MRSGEVPGAEPQSFYAGAGVAPRHSPRSQGIKFLGILFLGIIIPGLWLIADGNKIDLIVKYINKFYCREYVRKRPYQGTQFLLIARGNK